MYFFLSSLKPHPYSCFNCPKISLVTMLLNGSQCLFLPKRQLVLLPMCARISSFSTSLICSLSPFSEIININLLKLLSLKAHTYLCISFFYLFSKCHRQRIIIYKLVYIINVLSSYAFICCHATKLTF